MLRVTASSCRRAFAPPRVSRVPHAPAKRSVAAFADGGFDLDKVVSDLPVPVEYAYAGVAWGAFPRPSPAAAHVTVGPAARLGELHIVGFIIPSARRHSHAPACATA